MSIEKDIETFLAQPDPTSEPVAWMVETYYIKLREKVNRLSKEWVDYHLTAELLTEFYHRAEEELKLELEEKAHGTGEDDE